MVQGRTRRSRSSRQGSSPASGSTPDGGQDPAEAEALRETLGLVQEAEDALAPGDPGQEQGDAAARLRADEFVVEAVLKEGLGGSKHRVLQDELCSYAVPVLQRLLADGRLMGKAARLGRPAGGPGTWLSFTADDRKEFALDMVGDALPVFNKAVFESRRWSPGQGASLKTYFVNACIMQFARLHARWLKDRQAVRLDDLEADSGIGSPAPDPADTVALRDEVHNMLANMKDSQLRETVILRAAGFTHDDAARRAGLTPRQAEGRLARFRAGLSGGRGER
jgi:hypothetical protein